ncbi:SDR family NAD(P)-dependent oxidoreductase [Tahibacter sp.]|uniref:SDR family NAD(P)-dependent oxidoreductase n=1 Tax=Tahibacter sp. TaxID=2056211 RepID=UPI0028C37B25|nr:SDR family NAD(P)-dependent oxidoreductase [Tahibacter sp.]
MYLSKGTEPEGGDQAALRRFGDQWLQECAAGLAPDDYLDRLSAIADLHVQGYNLDYAALFAGQSPARLSLPTYPFATTRYWVEATDAAPVAGARAALHPLLHENTGDLHELRYSSSFDGTAPFVEHGELSATALLEMARAALELGAGWRVDETTTLSLADVAWGAPVTVVPWPQRVHIGLYAQTDDAVEFEIFTESDDGERIVHAQGRGERRLRSAATWAHGDAERLTLHAEETQYGAEGACALHPVLLQQVVTAARQRAVEPLVLQGIARLDVLSPMSAQGHALLHERPAGADGSRHFDIALRDEHDRVCVVLSDVVLAPARVAPVATVAASVSRADEPAAAVELMVFRERWVPTEGNAVATQVPKCIVLIAADEAFADTASVAFGDVELIVVVAGDHYVRRDTHRYAARCDDSESVRQALAAIGEAHGAVDALVYAATLRAAADGRQWRGVLGVVQGLAASRLEVGRVLFCACYEEAHARSHAESWIGMERSLRVIMPRLPTAIVLHQGALQDAEDVRVWTRRLRHELSLPAACNVRYAEFDRYELRVREHDLPAADAPDRSDALRDGGVYWITGGLGGLGALFARHLLARYGAKVVLSGRRPDAAREAEIADGTTRGELMYVAADVADAAAMRAGVASAVARFGRIDGVIHAAGLIEGGTLFERSPEAFARVLAPKVHGTQVLDDVFADQPLRFICYFSSSSGVLGDFGSADYAMANRFEMAYADNVQSRFRRVAIAWPVWADSGMGTGDAANTQLYLQTSGQQALTAADGIATFERLLGEADGHYLVMNGRRDRIEQALGLREPAPVAPEIAVPARGTARRRPELRGFPIEQCVQWDLKQQIGDLLKLSRDQIQAQDNLADYGFDSITLAQWATRISAHYAIEVTPAIFFSHSSLEKVSAYLLAGHRERLEQCYGGPDAVVEPAPPPAAIATRRAVRSSRGAASPARSGAASAHEPIAIIGMSGRFPEARTVDEMWKILAEGRSAVTEVALERFDWREDFASGLLKSKWLAAMPGVDEFDPLFFEISPREAQVTDPRQRLLLQEAWNALEDAAYGEAQLQRHTVGVFVGVEQGEYQLMVGGQGSLTGTHEAILASRLSYFLNLRGPAMAINTSCSSGMVAAHQACLSLRAGECDTAIAAAASVSLMAQTYASMSQAGMLSPDGCCYAFDRRANGMVPGEAVVAIVLKRLSQAEADGDPVHAVIRASGINYDGKTNGITAPNGASQARLIQSVFEQARVRPDDVDLMVTHGTGTRLGDPVEINALREVFGVRKGPDAHCAIVSTKCNFGHAFAASGLLSLVGAVLALRHETIPGSLNCEQPSDYIDWQDSALWVGRDSRPWPRSAARARTVGVSAFGMSGTNAHLLLQDHGVRETPIHALQAVPLVLSAKSAEALQRKIADLIDVLLRREWNAEALTAMSHTLLCGRQHFAHRCAVVVEGSDNALHLLRQLQTGERLPNLFRGVVPREFVGQAALTEYAHSLFQRLDGAGLDALRRQEALYALTDLYCQGYALPWVQMFGPLPPRRIALPTYPFERERYWIGLREAGLEPAAEQTAAAVVRESVLVKGWQEAALSATAVVGSVLIVSDASTQDVAQALSAGWAQTRIVRSDEDGWRGASDWSEWDALVDVTGCGAASHERLAWVEIVQAWVQARASQGGRALCVTRGEAGALQAGLYGMLQSEYGRIRARHVDLEAGDGEVWVAQVVQELGAEDDAVEVRYRDGRRYCAQLEEVELEASAELDWAPEGVLWITGGTRGLGLACARHFVRRHGVKRLVLTGREALPERSQWQARAVQGDATGQKLRALLALQAEGVRVEVSAVDLCDAAALAQEMDRVRDLGPIHGVLHCAGLADAQTPAFVRKTVDGMTAVLAPKVSGLETLLAGLRDAPLRFCVLFSSISAVVPDLATGQADYAMANAYMDHVARREQAGGLPVVSVQWGSWNESGMGEVKSRVYRELGLLSHSDAQGMDWLDRIVSTQRRGVLAPLQVDGSRFAASRLLRRRGPPVARANALAAAPAAVSMPSGAGLLAQVEGWLREVFAQQLQMPLEKVDIQTPLPDYGVDSVLLMQVLVPIGAQVNDALDPSMLYEHQTISAFARWLMAKYETVLRANLSTGEPAAPPLVELAPITPVMTASERACAVPPPAADEALAIVGLSCRFAGANDVAGYWELLAQGRSAIAPVPSSRWGETGADDWAALLEDVNHFDPEYFLVALADARAMDRQALLVLEESLKAWHHAGYTAAELKGTRSGVFLGARGQYHADPVSLRDAVNPILALGQNYLASNVSQFFDLRGPSLVVDTACSSALVALNMAMQGLRGGEIDAALVGGVSLLNGPGALRMFEQRGILQRGEFHIFDRRAQGAILGEGVGMVVLKRHAQAVADGDQIYALVRAAAVNNDGRTAGPTAPNVHAQKDVMRRALDRSGWRAADISHIDVNGSGSEITDLLELRAIEAVYRPDRAQPCELGSMKPNIGHPLCAEGIASLIKVVLMLHHGQRVPFLSAREPMAHYDLDASPFRFSRQLRPWGEAPRVAAINSFADGGTNAHVIVEGGVAHADAWRQPLPVPALHRIDVSAAGTPASAAPSVSVAPSPEPQAAWAEADATDPWGEGDLVTEGAWE